MISTTFEFSAQMTCNFSLKIDISACQIWPKLKFCSFDSAKNLSFLIRDTLKCLPFSSNLASSFWQENSNVVEIIFTDYGIL